MPLKVTYVGTNWKLMCDLLLKINANWHPISDLVPFQSYRWLLFKFRTVCILRPLPIPPLIFTEGQKVRNLASFSASFANHSTLSRTFENAARYPNSETKVQRCEYRPMSSPSLVKLGPRTREKALSVVPRFLKLKVFFGISCLLLYTSCSVYN